MIAKFALLSYSKGMKATFFVKYLLLLLILCCCPVGAESIFAQLNKLEQAVTIAVSRLDSGIEQDISGNADFARSAGRHLELALLSLDSGHLLAEDYYHLALYVIARQQANYNLALEVLEFEYKLAEFKALKSWLNKRIFQIKTLKNSANQLDRDFSIKSEFSSFRKMLKKNGA